MPKDSYEAAVHMAKAIELADEHRRLIEEAHKVLEMRNEALRASHDNGYSIRRLAAGTGLSSGTVGPIVAPRKDQQ